MRDQSQLISRIVFLEQMIANMMRPGVVEDTKGDFVKVRLRPPDQGQAQEGGGSASSGSSSGGDTGGGIEGDEFFTPFLPAGQQNGPFRGRVPFKKGQNVKVFAPTGDFSQAIIFPHTWNTDHPSPYGKDDASVYDYGDGQSGLRREEYEGKWIQGIEKKSTNDNQSGTARAGASGEGAGSGGEGSGDKSKGGSHYGDTQGSEPKEPKKAEERKCRIEHTDEHVKLVFDDASVTVDASGITLAKGQHKVTITKDDIGLLANLIYSQGETRLGDKNASNKVHRVGDKDSKGDTSMGGSPSVFVA